ncbi:tellurite resistance/C4-dicarboxylate transporter family protein [Salinisphaera sp.]|uniref:tellurite resistance/C4-dicarboxylate transporter family protein n=1 Tax=Salinisphaera sp. TaxID=1914330 RepID=UPI002D79F521|nr:tellurite resistance/C4-dicarboxylate transporter family protein [Salinisphaera sp.]HET7314614.1 tellurite resistance/C4-dicarboxylate transporter family protein [Salinisphaera sp.]
MDFPVSLRAVVLDLPPAYFALVMATGIVSIAAHGLGPAVVGRALFYLNGAFYAVLALLHGLRLILYPRRCLADLHDPDSGPGYFTWIAATAVLGSQCIVFAQAERAAAGLLAAAAVLWAVLTYAVFTALALRQEKPTLDAGINGGWLIAVVAMQSLAVLTTHLAGQWDQPARLELHFAALALWLAGIMLYLWLGLLIFYRFYFFALTPENLLPTHWISMGALAISTLAGSMLITHSVHGAPYLASLRPFLEGFTVFCWAGGTWWLPLLAIFGCWRHGMRGVPLTYEPMYWGLVFPLGMYAVATEHMSQSMGLAFTDPAAEIFCYIALVAWAVTFVGLVRRIGSALKKAVLPVDSGHG